jgi:hypothetical protein
VVFWCEEKMAKKVAGDFYDVPAQLGKLHAWTLHALPH